MLGKYGSIARDFMKENDPDRYAALTPGEIESMFSKINDAAHERLDLIINQMLAKDPIEDPNNFMESYQHREQIRRSAEEIVLSEIVYSKVGAGND